jgi:hypothetical protein
MADWQALRAHVATTREVHADELTMHRNPDWDALSVVVRSTSRPRLVIVARREDRDGVEWLELAVVVSDPANVDRGSCLEWNMRNIFGALGVNGDALMFKRVFPLAELDVASLDAAIEGTAAVAAGLREVLERYDRL